MNGARLGFWLRDRICVYFDQLIAMTLNLDPDLYQTGQERENPLITRMRLR